MNEKERAVMRQALEAMLNFPDDISDEMFESIRALRAALAQQQAEPSGYCTLEQLVVMQRTVPSPDKIAIYTAPPKADSAQEPGQDLIPPDSLFVCGQMGAHVTRVRLAEPAQEPLVWEPTWRLHALTQREYDTLEESLRWHYKRIDPASIYEQPPQRPPLTDEEMLVIIDAELEGGSLLDVARAIERKVRGE